MEESIKDRIILILVILAIIFFLGAVGSCSNTSKLKGAKDKELLLRLSAEEDLQKLTQEKKALEEKLKKTEQGLNEEKATHQATKKTLLQEQLVNKSLKEELEKVTRLKEKLEEDLKEVLAAPKK